MSQAAIKVHGVSKQFKLPHEKQNSIKGLFLNMFRGRRSFEKQKVLKDISFEIKEGEFFGIVGRNGSGKSTLLKLLAGIYEPNKGHIQVNGKLTPFIELGVGFSPDLTGRENVYLNGALLGFNRKEMDAMYDEIVEFAELESFMDQKLKNYSSGMQVRLAFSIAIRAKSDILLIDEVLAVGDYNFQRKCYEYFKYLQSQNKTVIFVSHDATALQSFCDKGILIENGSIIKSGAITDVLGAYTKLNAERIAKEQGSTSGANKPQLNIEDYGYLDMKQIYTTDAAGKTKNVFGPQEDMFIKYEFIPNKQLDNPVIGLVVQDASGKPLFATNTLDTRNKTGVFAPGKTVTMSFKMNNVFDDGKFYISGAVASSNRQELYYRFQNGHDISSTGWVTTAKGVVYLPYAFEVEKS